MNAFRYTANEEAPKPLKISLFALIMGSSEGRDRLGKLGNVLSAHKRTFSDFQQGEYVNV
jgi:hypothetical protein